MDLDRLRRAAARRILGIPRRVGDLFATGTLVRRDVDLVSTAGYRLAARLTRPAGTEPLPGVVVSPAIHEGRDSFESANAVVRAAEIARLGYAVLTFDPAGRGDSWGEEDFGGPEHQDDLRVAIRHLLAESTNVGVLSLSLGICASVGALVRYADELPVRWLVDWEGPSDREIVTAGGTRMVPAAGHTLDDDAWWHPREAIRGVGRLRCGYVRLQALPDHAQPEELRHAERMMRAAEAGDLPWFQVNDHPRGVAPPRPIWLPGGPLAANRAILRKLATLR
jgi:dienelactone hydrolase